MPPLFTRVTFIDVITNAIIEERFMPIARIEVASKAHARYLACLNNHPVLARKGQMQHVMQPRKKVNHSVVLA